MKNKLDPKNYIRHPKFVVTLGKEDSLSNSNGLILSAKLILISWEPVKLQSKDKISKGELLGTGLIRVSPLPTPIGKLAPTDFNLDIFNESFVNFLDLSKIEVPYQLSFRNPKGIITTQVSIQEYVESDIYSNHSMPNSSPVIA
jgi:hypothetical protein